jgi:hypothetical protein
MINFLIALSGDIFAVIIIIRGVKLIRRPQQKMLETEGDFKSRQFLGYGICLFGLLAIYANHAIFKF